MKNEGSSVLKFIEDKLGIKAFSYVSCPHPAIKLHFRNWRPIRSAKFLDFLKVCKCGMLYVNFHFVAVYNSAVMEFWPFPLEQRIKHCLNMILQLIYHRFYRS